MNITQLDTYFLAPLPQLVRTSTGTISQVSDVLLGCPMTHLYNASAPFNYDITGLLAPGGDVC